MPLTASRIIDKLYQQAIKALKLPPIRERLAASGADIVGSSPKEFALFIKREMEQNSKVVKAAGLKAD